MPKFFVGLVVLVLVVAATVGIFMMPSTQNKLKHIKSSVVGIERVATVYSDDGTEIAKFDGKFKIEQESPYKTTFVNLDTQKSVYISGGITIIEEK